MSTESIVEYFLPFIFWMLHSLGMSMSTEYRVEYFLPFIFWMLHSFHGFRI